MKNFFKTILLLSILIFVSNRGFAVEKFALSVDENYLITADKAVSKIEVVDEEIFVVKPFFTIFNEKNLMLLLPKKLGKSQVSFIVDNKKHTFEITVEESDKNGTEFCLEKVRGFSFLKLDRPPEALEILSPPKSIDKGEQ